MTDDKNLERLVVDTKQAEQKAREIRDLPDPLIKEVTPSLLSADHIERYVQETGLIAPFYTGGGRQSRLKKASYEGRIGKKAYVFDDNNELKPVLVPDEPLLVPANSIVFVESDLDFRLPQYIGLRYNLQIRHVHRGLLLGTGPLVDPGYWGKLCIPLHNLTNEDYHIPLKEGLVWFEFTKTTSDSDAGRNALDDGEEHSEYWDIEYFLRKAATPLVEGKSPIGIRSSIPLMAVNATNTAEKARDDSDKAVKVSETAMSRAKDAEKQASDTKALFNRIAWLGALVAGVAVVGLWASFVFGVRNDINALRGLIDSTRIEHSTIGSSQLSEQTGRSALLDRVNELEQLLEEAEGELEALRLGSSAADGATEGDGSGEAVPPNADAE